MAKREWKRSPAQDSVGMERGVWVRSTREIWWGWLGSMGVARQANLGRDPREMWLVALPPRERWLVAWGRWVGLAEVAVMDWLQVLSARARRQNDGAMIAHGYQGRSGQVSWDRLRLVDRWRVVWGGCTEIGPH
jgi:hypothetical protein